MRSNAEVLRLEAQVQSLEGQLEERKQWAQQRVGAGCRCGERLRSNGRNRVSGEVLEGHEGCKGWFWVFQLSLVMNPGV